MVRFAAIAILFATSVCAGQEYAGPRPPCKDTPYLVHADRLVKTEAGIAREQTIGDDITYIVPGARSMARTPLASPTLIVESAAMDVGRLQLFRMDVRNGHREISFHYKSSGGAIPLRTEITNVSGSLYRIEVVDSLASGEYALSPDGSNDVFCFEVF